MQIWVGVRVRGHLPSLLSDYVYNLGTQAPPMERTDVIPDAATTAHSVLVMLIRDPLCSPEVAASLHLALRRNPVPVAIPCLSQHGSPN